MIFITFTLSVTAAKANTILAAGTPGEPGTDVDARALAMGGAALALFDGSNVNALNPAVPASYDRAVFAVTLIRGYNSYETAQGRSVEITYDIPRAELAIPVSRSAAISFAFRQELNRNYEYTRPIEDEGGSIIGTNRVRGVGSVYSLSAGVASRIDDRWFGGVAVGYDFGAPKEISSREYKVKGYSWGEEISEIAFKGIKAGIGAGYLASDKLSFGAAAHVYGNHRVRVTMSNGYATIYEKDRRFAMPYSFGVGAAYVPGPRGRFAADARYTRWSRFAVDGEGLGYRDTFEFHAGAEGRLTTARKSFFLLRMPYRAGVSYVPWYATERGRFAKVGVSLGAGYLFMNNEDSRLDVTLVYGRRGDLATRGLEEEMFDFYLSIVGLETWLGKRERED